MAVEFRGTTTFVQLVYPRGDNPNGCANAPKNIKTKIYLTNSSSIGGTGKNKGLGGAGNLRHKVLHDGPPGHLAIAWYLTH